MDKETRLGLLASAILDGRPVDWQSVESTTDPNESAVVRQLRVLAEIAALHREPLSSAAPPVSAIAPRAAPRLERWGHLQVLELVGRGTYGDVYRAWDPHLDREVALKLLRTTATAHVTPSATVSDPARVVNEGRLLARVRHPHVITVYGAEPRDGSVGIWMEFIHGRTLHQIVEQQGPLSAREAAAVGVDLCGALAAVHAAGLLHRDVTARNVMREDGGRVVLMDFGAGHEAHAPARGTSGKDITGTPLYMAPELLSGAQAADRRTDVYALGALLFHLVTESFPVIGRTLAELTEAHARGTRTRLRDLRPDLPPPFVAAVEKAIAPDPTARFQTAGALEAALDRRVSDVQDVRTRRRALAAGIALGLIVVAATAGVVVQRAGSGADKTGGSGAHRTEPAVLTSVTMRKLVPPEGVWGLSNPSDDGRFVAATTIDTGDAAILDLVSGEFRALGVGRLDATPEDGYASSTVLSPDGTAIAVNWWADHGVLRLVRSDGTGLRTLVDTPGDAIPYQWSRDGSMILSSLVDTAGVNTIALVAAVDGAVRPLRRLAGWVNESPERMTLSPDGRYVAYDYPESATAIDRDIFILDTHTGEQWPLVAAPAHDSSPLWSPDGRTIVFFSDRSRIFSAWAVAMVNGRPQGEPRLVKDDVGRLRARGFTRAGALHGEVTTGFGELYISTLDQRASAPQLLSPRQSLSNLYPVWSPDGRWLAYVSERGSGLRRELWLYDAESRAESRIPVREKLDNAVGWSPDSTTILVRGSNNDRLYVVDRATGHAREIARDVFGAKWPPEGIVVQRRSDNSVGLLDPETGQARRRVVFTDSVRSVFPMALDGRSALAAFGNGKVMLRDVRNGAEREWLDSGVTFLGRHVMAPHTPAVAYLADRRDMLGKAQTLMVWGGAGAPTELLRVREPEQIVLHGWTTDGLSLLVTRWSTRRDSAVDGSPVRTLWRVPITGGAPVSTGLSMEALRDLSIHPDGRQIAFNARFKRSESWVMESLIPNP